MWGQLLHSVQDTVKLPRVPTDPPHNDWSSGKRKLVCSSAPSFPFIVINLVIYSHEKYFEEFSWDKSFLLIRSSDCHKKVFRALCGSLRRLQMCYSVLAGVVLSSCKCRAQRVTGEGVSGQRNVPFLCRDLLQGLETEVSQSSVTDTPDEISVPNQYCGRKLHCSLV